MKERIFGILLFASLAACAPPNGQNVVVLHTAAVTQAPIKGQSVAYVQEEQPFAPGPVIITAPSPEIVTEPVSSSENISYAPEPIAEPVKIVRVPQTTVCEHKPWGLDIERDLHECDGFETIRWAKVQPILP